MASIWKETLSGHEQRTEQALHSSAQLYTDKDEINAKEVITTGRIVRPKFGRKRSRNHLTEGKEEKSDVRAHFYAHASFQGCRETSD